VSTPRWQSRAPCRYFPVEATPLTMSPRLQPLGTDFGNGPADHLYFQVDREYEAYRAQKHRIAADQTPGAFGTREESEAQTLAHAAALAWAETTVASEHPSIRATLSSTDSTPRRWQRLALALQEDLVLLHRDAVGHDRVLAFHVSFPSDWRPEAILGANFQKVHAAVPGFAEQPETARSLVRAMLERGPFVRFVWTLCTDSHLDHHPARHPRSRFTPDTRPGWLRVERQVTIPLPAVQASVFLIRTYLTPFTALSDDERDTLSRAVTAMPEDVRRYKQLDPARVEPALRAAAAG